MPYLKSASEISAIVAQYTQAPTLWIDTEVADAKSSHPRLSLIQVLDNANDLTGDRTHILDVLNQPQIVAEFVTQVMINPAVEKVFHNAKYDLKFLGKNKAKNVTCTLEIAQKIPYYLLPLPNYKLQTLAAQLCNFRDIDKQYQTSDWGIRPLSTEQIEYAYLDCIYLAQVHQRLVELIHLIHPNPATDDVTALGERYAQIEQECKVLNSELEHLQARAKQAMQSQNLSDTSHFKLSAYERKTLKVSFSELLNMVQSQEIEIDFPITLTQQLQKQLGENIDKLSVEKEETKTWRLTSKKQDEE